MMQNPTDQAEASIPMETALVNSDSNMNRTVTVRRKAAKRIHPFDLAAEELHLVPSSPQAEDISVATPRGASSHNNRRGC
jgi:hypothetical protein